MSTIFGTALAGLNNATAGVQAAATRIAHYGATDNSNPATDVSSTNLATDLIDLKLHGLAFAASATLIDFENRRLGELLDILA